MPTDPRADFATRVHARPERGVLAFSGGGSGAIAQLLQVPGASNTILEARIPYAEPALAEWLGGTPDQACSADTACTMAMVAYQRALGLNASDRAPCFGFSLTASLATTRTKRGPHRAHLALQTASATFHWHLALQRDARDRAREEDLLSALALRCLGQGLGMTELPDLALTRHEVLEERHVDAPEAWQAVMAGNAVQTGTTAVQTPVQVLFPGAFNPLHSGHLGMAAHAKQTLGHAVQFEISLENVDKPPLNFLALEHRIAQFPADTPVWLTRCPTFTDKARAFPGATFVVGIDTLVRVDDARYYGGDGGRRNQAIREIADLDCRFLVFGRAAQDRFERLADHTIAPDLLALCTEVGEADFRDDASSSAIRRTAAVPRQLDPG